MVALFKNGVTSGTPLTAEIFIAFDGASGWDNDYWLLMEAQLSAKRAKWC